MTIGVYASPAAGNMHATLVEYCRRFPDVDVHAIDGGHDRLLCKRRLLPTACDQVA